MVDILQRIYDAKRAARAQDQTREPYDVLHARACTRTSERRGFIQAIHAAHGPAIIGEIKRASPSAGLIARNFDPASIARTYDMSRVDCISVLTEADHFLGDVAYLELARRNSSRPILRKDFLSTRYEIAQSAAYGADAVLLIVAGLSDAQLRECIEEAQQYMLEVLVEVHDAGELDRAVALNAKLIGINNRNLRTFETDLAVSEYLLPKVPRDVVVISESGMQSADDVVRLHRAGARGFLVGEALMRAEHPGELVRSLKSAIRTPAMH